MTRFVCRQTLAELEALVQQSPTRPHRDQQQLEQQRHLHTNEMLQQRRHQFRPLTDLLKHLQPDQPYTPDSFDDTGFGELRDGLLKAGQGPLDTPHVQRCNRAEADFWRRSEGYRIKPSDQLLQFDCGGQQWVWEVCFPVHQNKHKHKNNNNTQSQRTDTAFMDELLRGIESQQIAAHSPIEQRWSAPSRNQMSPAAKRDDDDDDDDIYSWVGIIMYLPSADDEAQRRDITKKFRGTYCDLLTRVGEQVTGNTTVSHWAKLEMPETPEELERVRALLRKQYPVDKFNVLRKILDNQGLMSNDLINQVFGKKEEKGK